MDTRWSEKDAHSLSGLELLVYLSRLIGADPSLVVWGGGNTSIKTTQADFRGRDTRTLLIKSSGSDLKTAGPHDFVGLRLNDILPLFDRDSMSDEEMVAYLEHCLLDPVARRPSIEDAATLLHPSHSGGPLPCRRGDSPHQHACIGVHTPRCLRRWHLRCPLHPARLPAFQLVGRLVRDQPAIKGVVLANHGLFTWGDSAKQAYDNHLELVTEAEEYAERQGAGKRAFGAVSTPALDAATRRRVASDIAPTFAGCRGTAPAWRITL